MTYARASCTAGLAFVLSFGSAFGAGGMEPYPEALLLLANGEYEAAAERVRASTETLPNIATYELLALAEARSGRAGEAVWALRSAAALGGTESGAKELRSEVYAEIPADLRPLPRRGVDAVAAWTTRVAGPNAAALVALVGVLVVGGLGLRYLLSRAPGGGGLAGGAVTAMLIAVGGLWIALRQNALAHPDEAVTIEPTSLRTAPSAEAPLVRELTAGAVVTTGERLAGHVAVVLPTGAEGWVVEGSLRTVAPLPSDG